MDKNSKRNESFWNGFKANAIFYYLLLIRMSFSHWGFAGWSPCKFPMYNTLLHKEYTLWLPVEVKSNSLYFLHRLYFDSVRNNNPDLVVAIACGLASFRFGLPFTIRSTFYPIFGEYCWGWIGDTIDGYSIVMTVAAVCTSLGLGTIQIIGKFQCKHYH